MSDRGQAIRRLGIIWILQKKVTVRAVTRKRHEKDMYILVVEDKLVVVESQIGRQKQVTSMAYSTFV